MSDPPEAGCDEYEGEEQEARCLECLHGPELASGVHAHHVVEPKPVGTTAQIAGGRLVRDVTGVTDEPVDLRVGEGVSGRVDGLA